MNIFSRIRIPKLGRNNFDLSFENKFTCQMGQLVPFMCQEVLPGDQFKNISNILVRFNPLVAPMMHRVDVYTHFFFVPNRLIWDDWEDFITGGEDGLARPVKPYTTWRQLMKQTFRTGPGNIYVDKGTLTAGSLLDFLGYNLGLTDDELETIKATSNIDELDYDWLDIPMDILPLRAYLLIYNEYYRNQNTQSEIEFYKGSGFIGYSSATQEPELEKLIKLKYRNWSLDYFTSALPFSQRGPEQLVPITNSSLTYKNDVSSVYDVETGAPFVPTDYDNNTSIGVGVSGVTTVQELDSNNALVDNTLVGLDVSRNLDLQGGNISIRDLRRAERVQEWLERSARAGARYIEQLKGHFGVFSSDSRLQRPEYLGGGKQVVQISAVDQTSATDLTGSTTPLGSMAGKAISGGSTNGFKTKELEEHGFIIGIMSVLPKGGYHQGLNRKFSRFDKLDYFWPEFQNIGDQELKTKEIYFAQSASNNTPDLGFGYTPRYAEYKANADEVHGDFKTTLDFWHLNRKFAEVPKLNGNFSTTKNNIRQDIFAVQTDAKGNNVPNMMIDVFNNLIARRPMLYYENPDL